MLTEPPVLNVLGVGQRKHRRRVGDLIEADFWFISQHGEVSENEPPGAIKVLVMTEIVSNSIACVVVVAVRLV